LTNIDQHIRKVNVQLRQFARQHITLRTHKQRMDFAFESLKVVHRHGGITQRLQRSMQLANGLLRYSGFSVGVVKYWHFDRELEDMFAVQDEVTEAIIAAIAPEISDMERERAQRSPPESLDAWSLYQRGLVAYYSSTKKELKSAIDQFDGVNEIDPTFAPAFSMAAAARWRYTVHFDPVDRAEYLHRAQDKGKFRDQARSPGSGRSLPGRAGT
jgi:hypothetical protein